MIRKHGPSSHPHAWSFIIGVSIAVYAGCSSNGSGVTIRKDAAGDGAGSVLRLDAQTNPSLDGSLKLLDGSVPRPDVVGSGGITASGGTMAGTDGGIVNQDVAAHGGSTSSGGVVVSDGSVPSGDVSTTGGSLGAGGVVADAGAKDVRTGGVVSVPDGAMDVPVIQDSATVDSLIPSVDTKASDTRRDTAIDVLALTDAGCGNVGEPCCARETCTAVGTVCTSGSGAGSGICTACGALNQPCCEGEVCTAAGATCQGGSPRGSGTCR